MDKKVLLISFYNAYSLGVRYLENALIINGCSTIVVYFKAYHSVSPKKITHHELALLGKLIKEHNPLWIGLSVMTSLYLDGVEWVSRYIKENFTVPVVWGGVYPTMFPEKCLHHADFVIRGEGELPVIELTDVLANNGGIEGVNIEGASIEGASIEGVNIKVANIEGVNIKAANIEGIKNLCYKANGKVICNEMNKLCMDIDKYSIPAIGLSNKYFIEDNTIINRDVLMDSSSYELAASRGCPFACSYCCSAKLMKISAKNEKYMRCRDADHVIEELLVAKSKIKGLSVIHFWDEIFPNDEKWIEKFSTRYKKEIGIPFEIWVHPLRMNEKFIERMKYAGLYKAVMGIQSGSPYIRKKVFNRGEKQTDIIMASRMLKKYDVPLVFYDFILRHPFETVDTIKESYALVDQLAPPFALQLHNLKFLPGTDIVKKVVDDKLISSERIEQLLLAPMEEQYKNWWESSETNANSEIDFWYNMIFIAQFPRFTEIRRKIAGEGMTAENLKMVAEMVHYGKYLRCSTGTQLISVKRKKDSKKKYIIFGAGVYGALAFNELGKENIAFFADNFLTGLYADTDIKIITLSEVKRVYKEYNVLIAANELNTAYIAMHFETQGIENYLLFSEVFTTLDVQNI